MLSSLKQSSCNQEECIRSCLGLKCDSLEDRGGVGVTLIPSSTSPVFRPTSLVWIGRHGVKLKKTGRGEQVGVPRLGSFLPVSPTWHASCGENLVIPLKCVIHRENNPDAPCGWFFNARGRASFSAGCYHGKTLPYS